MNYLPIFVQIKQRPCLVVGGGSIAARKVALLRKAEGAVTVVSPELCSELSELAAAGQIQHKAKTFSAEDMDMAQEVFSSLESINAGIMIGSFLFFFT